MSVTATCEAPDRHPWLDAFDRVPQVAFGDLLAGYAKIPPYERADAPDAARMLFGPLPKDDPVRGRLGPAILGWLEQRRRERPPVGRPRLQHWVAEICEALEIISALDVADAARALRRRYIVWNEWTAGFVLSPARDAHAAYWRMLALTQPLLARPAVAVDRGELAALWLEICRQAGAALPRRYLAIGLLGLRRLPGAPTGSEAPWVAGLAQWAVARTPSEAEFQAEWRALKPLYPRTSGRWRDLVGRLLATPEFRDRRIEAPAWWRGDPDFTPMTRPDFRVRGEALRSPLPRDCDAVIDHLSEPWLLAEPRIDALMQQHRRFLSATGDSQYVVRAVHALGTALIQPGADEPRARARKAQALAREGLDWQPYDRYLWSLWRDALAAEGALEAAELIGWEFVRRDPEHVEGRNQLATLLAETLHRPAEAAALLRDTIAAFPDDPFARTQLATLLAETLHRPAEAEALLRDTIAAVPDDSFARNQLAELLVAADRLGEAEAVVDAAFAARATDAATYALRARLQSHRGLAQEAAATLREGVERLPPNPALRDYQRVLARGRPLRLLRAAQPQPAQAQPEAAVAPADDPEKDDLLRYGRLRRLRFRAGGADPVAGQAALEEVRAILRDEPTFAYAELLAARYGLQPAADDALPVFAVAFEQALAAGDLARLEALAQQQPRLQALILVARAVLGDEPAAWLVATLLNAPPARDEARPVTILRAGLRPIVAAANGAAIPQVMASRREAILRCLHDTNEAMLGDRIAA